MKINKLSASSFDNYKWCEWQYFLNSVCGFPSDSIPSGIIGHICHKVAETLSRLSIIKHRKDSKFWDVEYLWKICFNRCYKEEPLIAEKIKTDKLKIACKGMKELLAGPYSPISEKTLCAEKYFKIKINPKDDYSVTGKIDRVDKIDEETIEIVDYKTGSRSGFLTQNKDKKDAESLSKDIQPKIYFWAAKKLYPWAKTILVTFIYITDGGPVTIIFCDDDLPAIEKELNQMASVILNNNDPRRDLTWKCKCFCTYGKNGTCDNTWSEKEEVGFEFLHEKYTTLRVRR